MGKLVAVARTRREKTPLSEGNNEEDDVPPGFGTNSGTRVNPGKEKAVKAVYDIIVYMKKIPVLLSMFHALNFLHGARETLEIALTETAYACRKAEAFWAELATVIQLPPTAVIPARNFLRESNPSCMSDSRNRRLSEFTDVIVCTYFIFSSRLGWCSVYRLCSLCEASGYKIEKNARMSRYRVFREKVPSFNIMIGSTRPDHE